MTTAYIINNNNLIAIVDTELKNGASVQFASSKCVESINAAREFNLVNAKSGKISRAAKWGKQAAICNYFGTEINPSEFYIS